MTEDQGATALDEPAEAPPAKGKGQGGRAVDYKEQANRLVDRCLERARNDTTRKTRDRIDWRNLEVFRGGEGHWKVWNNNTGRYEVRGTDPERGGIPEYVPRCSTNIFAVHIDGVASILDQTKPSKECGPGSPDDRDRAAAEVAQDALPVILEEMGYEEDRAQLHKLIALTGRCGYAVYCDNDTKHGTDELEVFQCVACDELMTADEIDDGNQPEQGQPRPTVIKCPKCGATEGQDPTTGEPVEAIKPAQDPRTGALITKTMPKGRIVAKIVHGFELSTPPGVRTTNTAKMPWCMTHTRQAHEDIIGRWPKLRGKLEAGSWADAGDTHNNGSEYADAMVGLVAPVSDGSRGAGSKLGPVVLELWHDPIDDGEYYFPEGLYFVRVQDQIATSGPLPYVDQDGKPFKNILIRQWASAPGNAAGKPPGDDLEPLQMQRNLVETLGDLILLHEAAPTMFVPLSVSLIDEPTGAPGERIRYRSTVPGESPTTVRGQGRPPDLKERIEEIDAAMDRISKLNAVLAGERPTGDPTLGEIEILREQGQSSFSAPLEGLVQFEIALSRQALAIARDSIWTERFIKIHGENGAWDVQAFLGADLDGRVDIYIDRASAWPKSPLVRALRRKEALEMGLLSTQDPEVAGQLLSEMDLDDLKPSVSVDLKQITRELDKWKRAQDPAEIAQPNPMVQELPIHRAYKRAFLKTEEAEAIAAERPEVYAAMLAHMQQIDAFLNPQPPAGPAGSSVEQLVNDGVLTPADGQGPAGTGVQDMVDAGVLTPADGQPPGGAGIGEMVGAGVLQPAPPQAP